MAAVKLLFASLIYVLYILRTNCELHQSEYSQDRPSQNGSIHRTPSNRLDYTPLSSSSWPPRLPLLFKQGHRRHHQPEIFYPAPVGGGNFRAVGDRRPAAAYLSPDIIGIPGYDERHHSINSSLDRSFAGIAKTLVDAVNRFLSEYDKTFAKLRFAALDFVDVALVRGLVDLYYDGVTPRNTKINFFFLQ